METKILKPLPLFTMGYDKIKSLIINGTLIPGQRLTDKQLSNLLGISRTPVREAVRILCQEGLLVGEDGILTVYEPTPKDLGEIYTVRASLEGLALSIIVARGIHEQFADELQEYVDISLAAERSRDYDRVAECNRRVHSRIIEASENQLIAEQMKTINEKMHLFRRLSLKQDTHVKISIIEHQELVKKLRKGNTLECRYLLEKHIIHAGNGLFWELINVSAFKDTGCKPIGDYFEMMIKLFDNDFSGTPLKSTQI